MTMDFISFEYLYIFYETVHLVVIPEFYIRFKILFFIRRFLEAYMTEMYRKSQSFIKGHFVLQAYIKNCIIF